MTALEIRLLGSFEVKRADAMVKPDEWPTRKAQTLLKVLVAERDHVVPAARLVDLLWPDLEPDSGLNSLRVSISHLRRILEPHLTRAAESKYVQTRSGGYVFRKTDDCWIDVDAFNAAVAQGHEAAAVSYWDAAIQAYAVAAELYRGDYLTGEKDASWTIGRRQRLHETHIDVLQHLAEAHAKLGDYRQALAYCREAVARDAVRESAYRQMMSYYYAAGDRSRALEVFERCRQVLAEDLGVDPMQETLGLHVRILREEIVEERANGRQQAQRVAAQREEFAAEHAKLVETNQLLLELQRDQQAKVNLLLRLQQRDAAARTDASAPEKAPPRPPADVACPYKGLAAFEVEDTDYFFGRERLLAQLTARLASTNLLAILGASGTGKSSVVRAGLIPAVQKATIPDCENWQTVVFTPGPRPLGEFTRRVGALLNGNGRPSEHPPTNDPAIDSVAAATAAQETGLLIVVDQFEEAFTLCDNDDERRAFINALLDAATGGAEQVKVVVAIRSDFYGRCADYPVLADRLQEDHVLVTPMQAPQLRQVIERPADMVGLRLEPGLVDTIVSEVADAPGALPLLSHALVELYYRREGHWLTHRAYDAIGRVEGALEQRAEALYEAFTPPEQRATRKVFLRLTQVGDRTEDTRRRAYLSELSATKEDAAVVQRVVHTLADARLVTLSAEPSGGEAWVEVTHEALIRGWNRLGEWLNDDRAFLVWRQRLHAARSNWEAAGRDPGVLLGGGFLAEAEHWLRERPGDLNLHEQAYIRASLHLREQRQAERETLRRRIILGLAAALVVTGILAGLAAGLWQRAENQQEVALTRQLAAQADLMPRQRAGLLPRSVLLAVESVRRNPSLEGEQALRSGLALLPAIQNHRTFTSPTSAVAYSPGRNLVAVGDPEGAVHVWNIGTGEEIGAINADGHIGAATFSPDGQWLAVGTWAGTISVLQANTLDTVTQLTSPDGIGQLVFSPDSRQIAAASEAAVFVWDVATGERVATVAHNDEVNAVAWNPDGQRLATASDDGTAYVWDVVKNQPVARLEHDDEVKVVSFSPDGQWIVTGADDGIVGLWAAESGDAAQVMRHDKSVTGVAFSPDGTVVATTSDDRTARLWDIPTGWEVLSVEHEDEVKAVAFSPDGRWLATGSEDTTARVWEVATGSAISYMPHAGGIIKLAFTNDNRRLVVTSGTSDDSAITVWQALADGTVRTFYHGDEVAAVVASADEERLFTGSDDGTAVMWDVSTGEARMRIEYGAGATGVALSPDEQWLVTTTDNDPLARVWSVATGELVTELAHGAEVNKAVFGPVGNILVTGSDDAQARIWQIPSGELKAVLEHEDDVRPISFSPDGEWVATGSTDGTARIWEAATGRPIATLTHEDDVNDVAFSPDGRWLATAGKDGYAYLWDATTRETVLRLAQLDEAKTLAFSPDSNRVAVGHSQGATLWEIPRGRKVAEMPHADDVAAVAFSPNGRWLATASDDATARVWDAETGEQLAYLPHGRSVNKVAFMHAGEWLVTASDDRTARIWWWQLADLIDVACQRLTRNLTVAEWAAYLPNEPYRATCPNLPLLQPTAE